MIKIVLETKVDTIITQEIMKEGIMAEWKVDLITEMEVIMKPEEIEGMEEMKAEKEEDNNDIGGRLQLQPSFFI